MLVNPMPTEIKAMILGTSEAPAVPERPDPRYCARRTPASVSYHHTEGPSNYLSNEYWASVNI